MPTYTRLGLTGIQRGSGVSGPILDSTNLNTGVSGLIHKSSTTVGVVDELWLWSTDNVPSPQFHFVEDGQPAGGFSVTPSVAAGPSGPVVLFPGVVMSGGLEIWSQRQTTGSVQLYGHINRITP